MPSLGRHDARNFFDRYILCGWCGNPIEALVTFLVKLHHVLRHYLDPSETATARSQGGNHFMGARHALDHGLHII